MVDEWIETTVGEQITLQRGMDITKAEQRKGSVPVVSSGGIASYHDTVGASGPGVVLGRKGVVGSVYFVPSDYWPHDTTLWVKDFHGNDPRFVYYFFRWLAPQLASMDVGSANPTLNRNHVHPMQMRWPPVSDQRIIARILGTLDDKIESNKSFNQTLEATARALFKSWFIDFDPVYAKRAGEDPESICRHLGLTPSILAIFPDRFEDSSLGEIPQGWSVGTVDEEFELTMGQSPPGETYNQIAKGIPFYQGRTDFGFRFPVPRVYCTAATRFARPGDTLVSVRAPVGDLNMANEECAIGRGVAAVKHKSGGSSYTYYSMLFQQRAFSRFEAEGTVFGSIGKKDFHKLACLTPDRALIKQFERIAGPLDMRIRASEEESSTLITMRDLLLPRLVSGTLNVSVPGGR